MLTKVYSKEGFVHPLWTGDLILSKTKREEGWTMHPHAIPQT